MKIALASDHAGFDLKEEIKKHLLEIGNLIEDFGTDSKESFDYPDSAFPAAKSVAAGTNDLGIIICGSGVGVSIVANKVKGVRAANVFNEEMARLARQHNDANVLTLGARFIDPELARRMAEAFISTAFEGGRHSGRVDKIHGLTGC